MLAKSLILANFVIWAIQIAHSTPVLYPRYEAVVVEKRPAPVKKWVDQYGVPVDVEQDKKMPAVASDGRKACKSSNPVTDRKSHEAVEQQSPGQGTIPYEPAKRKPKTPAPPKKEKVSYEPAKKKPKIPAPPREEAVSYEPAKKKPKKEQFVSVTNKKNKPGIVYSPIRDDGSCKNPKEVAKDIAILQDYSFIRLYGINCDQVQNVIAAVQPYGIQVFIGVSNINKYEEELHYLIKVVDGRWSSVHTVSIGNEVVNFNFKTADQFAGIINHSRQILRSQTNYKGPVVGVDTFVAIMNNPGICNASDYVAANCHPFFDGNVLAEDSGKFLDNMKIEIRKKCGDKKIMITEVGWPTQGGTNGKAVPSVENQKAALKSIIETQGNDVILFTAFNDLWKKDTPLTFGVEKYWGIQDLTLVF